MTTVVDIAALSCEAGHTADMLIQRAAVLASPGSCSVEIALGASRAHCEALLDGGWLGEASFYSDVSAVLMNRMGRCSHAS